MDKQYLAAIGWHGIRVRKVNIEDLLKKQARKLTEQGDVRVLDIASGHGRYILDAVAGFEKQPASVLLRGYGDHQRRGRSSSSRNASCPTLRSLCMAMRSTPNRLRRLRPKVNLAVVSGLYELFNDNDLLRRSLEGLERWVEPGSYLVYTCQIWHPQQEFIALVLTSHRQGDAWVMRMRSQAEMDALVEQAGFRGIDQRIRRVRHLRVAVACRL